MMALIDQASHLSSLIRSQVAATPVGREPGHVIGKRPGDAKQTPEAPTDRNDFGRVKDSFGYGIDPLVLQRVRSLAPDDPQRRRKAFRIYLESTLSAEFGPALAGSAGFEQLVEQVLLQMESDSELNATIQKAADILLTGNLA